MTYNGRRVKAALTQEFGFAGKTGSKKNISVRMTNLLMITIFLDRATIGCECAPDREMLNCPHVAAMDDARKRAHLAIAELVENAKIEIKLLPWPQQ